jgi:DnaK suppressor protein
MNNGDLSRLRTKIVEDLNNLEAFTSSARAAIRESAAAAPNYLQSESDAAKDVTDVDCAVTVHDHCAARKQVLKDALVRMNRADFGICQDCDCEIGAQRLYAMPGATRCIQCQKVSEWRHTPSPRQSTIMGVASYWGVA